MSFPLAWSPGATLGVALVVLAVLAAAVVSATAARRRGPCGTGVLSAETRRRDEPHPSLESPRPEERAGRVVERAAKLEREAAGAVALLDVAPPAPAIPPDAETVGVTRRQFFNRGIIALFGLGLSAFGGAILAFLWPQLAGGFGAKIRVGKLDDVLAEIRGTREPKYVAEGRLYVNPYPRGAVDKAEQAYDGAVLAGMKEGVVALYQKCPHLGCRVPWCKTSQWFECPCHGSQYNRVGEKKGGPAPRGMDRFGVDTSGGQLTVDTGTLVPGPPIGTNTTGQEAEGPHCIGAVEE